MIKNLEFALKSLYIVLLCENEKLELPKNYYFSIHAIEETPKIFTL